MSGFVPRPMDRRPASPRRVRSGIRLRAKEGLAPKSWIAQRWLSMLETMLNDQTAHEGLEYAQLGQITTVSIGLGTIDAGVQGRSSRPYTTSVTLAAFASHQWESILDAMSDEAIYAAKLLANELPEATHELFASRGLQLIPAAAVVDDAPDATVVAGDLRSTCNCGFHGFCKHAAAVGYLLTEYLDDDPLLIFTLRGMRKDQVLEALRRRRAIQTHGVAAAHAEPMLPQLLVSVPPLEESLEEFWRLRRDLSEISDAPSQHASHALLRRLGPSPLNGRFPLAGLLASIYDTVSAAAMSLRDHAERLDEKPEDNSQGSRS